QPEEVGRDRGAGGGHGGTMIESPRQAQTEPPMAAAGRGPRVALAHDWLCGYRGGEAGLERIAALGEREFEPAGLWGGFDEGRALPPTIALWRRRGLLHHSWVSGLPGSGRGRRWMLPLYPCAVGHLSRTLAAAHTAQPIDLLISTSSAAVKGISPPAGVP